LNIQNRTPSPTKSNILERLIANIPITSIVDVGVRECTGELIKAFPRSKHYLFEPVTTFFNLIRKNYSGLEFELMPFALSDEDNIIHLVLSSLNKDGVVTHSSISDKAVEPDGKFIVSCTPVSVMRFDSYVKEHPVARNFLLKVDVDGKDLEVVWGFGEKIRDASAIIIECTVGTFVPRASHIISSGFLLVDVVDLIYYGDSLYQFDAVFVRNDLIDVGLCPPISEFKRELWHKEHSW